MRKKMVFNINEYMSYKCKELNNINLGLWKYISLNKPTFDEYSEKLESIYEGLIDEIKRDIERFKKDKNIEGFTKGCKDVLEYAILMIYRNIQSKDILTYPKWVEMVNCHSRYKNKLLEEDYLSLLKSRVDDTHMPIIKINLL